MSHSLVVRFSNATDRHVCLGSQLPLHSLLCGGFLKAVGLSSGQETTPRH